jgi:hypothetical protein
MAASPYSGRTGGLLISACSQIPWPVARLAPPPDGDHAAPIPSRRRTARQDPASFKACCRGSKTLPEPTMNYYGEMAQRHWARWLPHQYATIEDPDSFFSDLGSRVEARIDELADQLAGDDQAGEGYLDKAGRIGQARRQAEEIVLSEMVLLQPEADR